MKKLILIFLFLINLNICFSQTGWYIQPGGTTDALFDVFFFDMNTGIIVGGTAANTAVILRTINGGILWDQINPNTNILLRSVSFITASTGIAVGGNFKSSVILKTTDSGISWDTINSPVTSALRCVSFPPTGAGMTGYTVGFNGTAMKTTDTGNNWIILNTGLGTQMIFSVHFTDVNNGTAVGGTQIDTATIIRTTDGGISWISQVPNTNNLLRGVYFLNEFTGFAVGNNGTILKTANSGINWNVLQTNIPSLFLRDIYFVDSLTGFIAGSNGTLLKTTNGGDNWFNTLTGTSNDLQAVYFLDQRFGTAVGFDGIIIHTDSGGVITSSNTLHENFTRGFHLQQNYPNPFNPETNIRYSISEDSYVSLKIFDASGNEIAVLTDQKNHAGDYSIIFNGTPLSSGIYFYKLSVNDKSITKKMILLK